MNDQQWLEVPVLALYACGPLRFLNRQANLHAQPRAFSDREAEVLKWVAAGKTASEIADITGLAARTINQHCENVQNRFGANSRVHTVVETIRKRLILL